jgi:hypothetical protein
VIVIALEFTDIASGHWRSGGTVGGLFVLTVPTLLLPIADPGNRNAFVAPRLPIRRTSELVFSAGTTPALLSGALVAVVSAIVFPVADERPVDAVAVVALEHVGALTLGCGIFAARTALVPSIVTVVVSIALPGLGDAASTGTLNV